MLFTRDSIPTMSRKKAGRAAPKKPKPTAKSKVSIAVPAGLLCWAEEKARTQSVSVSSVFCGALKAQQRSEAAAAYLAEVGSDDITSEDMEKMHSEWRAAGIKI